MEEILKRVTMEEINVAINNNLCRNTQVIFGNDVFKLVKREGLKGDSIPKHRHKDEYVIFSVISGNITVYVNDKRIDLKTGDKIDFDGICSIRGDFNEDSLIVVALVKK